MQQASPANQRVLYPAFLDLRGRSATVVGGGEVALRKVESLLAAGAQVKVVAPELHPAIEALAQERKLSVERRPYRRGDLDGTMLAVAATSDDEVNREVSREASERNVFLNVVDEPELCSFLVPSTIRRDALTVAVSTGGLSPALAKRIRERLEETLAPEYGGFLRLLGTLRPRLRAELPSRERRERFWTEAVNSNAFDLYRSEGEAAARARLEEILRHHRA